MSDQKLCLTKTRVAVAECDAKRPGLERMATEIETNEDAERWQEAEEAALLPM